MSAAGDVASILFVFKGKNMPFRDVLSYGEVHLETLQSHLLKGSLVYMREDVDGIDSSSFLPWRNIL